MKPAYLALMLMALLLSSCSASTTSVPDATPAPTTVSQPVAEPTATPSVGDEPTAAAATPDVTGPTATAPAIATLDPRALDTAGIEECDLLANSDFSSWLGQTPVNINPAAEVNSVGCRYTFTDEQIFVDVTIRTELPGEQIYDGNLQYPDFAAGSESLTLGTIAIVKQDGDRVLIDAVINGWYVEVSGSGFDPQTVINLARLFEERLVPYYPPPDVAATATPAAQGDAAGACRNTYYPVAQGASWQY